MYHLHFTQWITLVPPSFSEMGVTHTISASVSVMGITFIFWNGYYTYHFSFSFCNRCHMCHVVPTRDTTRRVWITAGNSHLALHANNRQWARKRFPSKKTHSDQIFLPSFSCFFTTTTTTTTTFFFFFSSSLFCFYLGWKNLKQRWVRRWERRWKCAYCSVLIQVISETQHPSSWEKVIKLGVEVCFSPNTTTFVVSERAPICSLYFPFSGLMAIKKKKKNLIFLYVYRYMFIIRWVYDKPLGPWGLKEFR